MKAVPSALLVSAAQFVNAHFGASDNVQRSSRFRFEIHEGKACARQVKRERAKADLNPLFPFGTGRFRHTVAHCPDIRADFETAGQADGEQARRAHDLAPGPKPLAVRGGLFEGVVSLHQSFSAEVE